MKNIILLLFSLSFLTPLQEIQAQQCACNVNLNPVSPCCADLQVIFDINCVPGTVVDQIDLYSNAFPPFVGNIQSATGANSNITGSLVGSQIATFISTTNLADPALLGTVITVGQVCFEDVNNGAVTASVVASGAGVTYCEDVAELIINCPTPPPPGDFKKLYGSADDEKPKRVLAVGDGIYVIGRKTVSGQNYGSFSKFDITTGALICETYIDELSEFNDIAFNPNNNEFVVVGHTTSPSTIDNRSLICTFSTTCNLTAQKVYDHNGREGFQRVLVHKNPEDPNYPIYVVGNKNPNGQPANSTDEVMLYNFDGGLNVNFWRNYTEVSNVELEGFRGMEDLDNGDLILLGNGSIANEGTLIHVDGLTGSFLSGHYYPGVIDFYDAVETSPGGDIILAGTDFGNNQALLLVVDQGFNPQAGMTFPDVSTFKEIGMDAYNNIYTVGETTGTAPNFNVVHKVSYDPTTTSLNVVYYKYLDDNEADYDEPHLFVSPDFDHIFYADARLNNASGFGGWDMLVGVTDLDFNCLCVEPFSQMEFGYIINKTTFSCTDPSFSELPLGPLFVPVNYADSCAAFCTNAPLCDFTFTVNCFTVSLNGTPTGGTPPYSYGWDIDCDGVVDITGQNPIWTFPSLPPSSTHCIKMIVTDATGVSCEIQKQVTVGDQVPPVLSCPMNMTLNTDPGQCFATFPLPITSVDDCDPMPMTSCMVSGATSGNSNTTQFNKGVTNITCFSTDASGNMSTCSFDITVVDNEPPVINCPSNITVTIPGCDGGTNVNFPPPTFSDNCPMVSYTCSHQSGDYFNCGTTTITCTATDMAGNTSTCTFNVVVVCECAELINSSMVCNPTDENIQDFSITLLSLSGLPMPGNFCTASVSTTQTGLTLSNIATNWTGTQVTITGSITFNNVCPSQVALLANMNCVCPNGTNLSCNIPVFLAPQCCKTISIGDTIVCKNGPTISIPLNGCDDLCDVQQVRWYVADAPCPPTSWGLPFQVTNTCQDLLIDPQFHNGDICIYAEVVIGTNGGPCQSLMVSDTATLTLCEPVGCTVSTSQNYCYFSTPITPTALIGTINPPSPNCPYTVQWWDANGPIPGETQLTYQPPALSIPVGSTVCSQSTTYTMKVTSECGVSECAATIVLDNEDAPLGLLEMDPLEPTPFCPGEDATMRYTPECAGTPARWDWLVSNDNITFTNITTAGNQNPLYNTNRLYQDTWFRIEKKNGSCPVDTIDYFIPVNGPLTINSFTAVHAPVCAPTAVDLMVDFGPIYPSPCSYTVTWYRNGLVINTSTATTSPVSYTYTPASTDDIAGNYYVVISNSCCDESLKSNVVQVGPPCEAVVLGPCFRCNMDTISLDGILLNPIPGAICTYQWYDENGLIPGATGTSLTVNPNQKGPFTFEVTCTINGNVCIKTAVFNLKQCGNNIMIPVKELIGFDVAVYPNPVGNQLIVDLGDLRGYEELVVYDVIGRPILNRKGDSLARAEKLEVGHLPAGLYLLRIKIDSQISITKQFIKQ